MRILDYNNENEIIRLSYSIHIMARYKNVQTKESHLFILLQALLNRFGPLIAGNSATMDTFDLSL